jgi:hypothetical protein
MDTHQSWQDQLAFSETAQANVQNTLALWAKQYFMEGVLSSSVLLRV